MDIPTGNTTDGTAVARVVVMMMVMATVMVTVVMTMLMLMIAAVVMVMVSKHKTANIQTETDRRQYEQACTYTELDVCIGDFLSSERIHF